MRVETVVCDGCGELAEPDGWGGAPAGWWLLAELTGRGGDWRDETEFHACSPECAIRVLQQIVDGREPEEVVPASSMDSLRALASGVPADRSLVDELLDARRDTVLERVWARAGVLPDGPEIR